MHTELLVVLLVAIFAIPCQSEVGRCVEHLQAISAVKLDLEEPVDWRNACRVCQDQGMRVLFYSEKLNEAERALCGDQLVPYDETGSTKCWKNFVSI